MLACYKKEESYIVWKSLSDVLNGLDSVLSEDETLSSNYQTFAKSLILPLSEKVGWAPASTDNHLTTLLRGIMIHLLASFCAEDAAVQQEANRRFDLFWNNYEDVDSLPSDYRSAVFSIVLQSGNNERYEQIKSYYKKAPNNAEAKHVLNSLGSISDEKLKWATMEWSTSGDIKLQDFFYVMGSVARSNKVGRDTAWKYFQDEFDKLKDMLASASPSLMNAVIVLCAGGGSSMAKADAVKEFFEEHPMPSNSRKIDQTIEGITANAKFYDTLTKSPLAEDDSFWTKAMVL